MAEGENCTGNGLDNFDAGGSGKLAGSGRAGDDALVDDSSLLSTSGDAALGLRLAYGLIIGLVTPASAPSRLSLSGKVGARFAVLNDLGTGAGTCTLRRSARDENEVGKAGDDGPAGGARMLASVTRIFSASFRCTSSNSSTLSTGCGFCR